MHINRGTECRTGYSLILTYNNYRGFSLLFTNNIFIPVHRRMVIAFVGLFAYALLGIGCTQSEVTDSKERPFDASKAIEGPLAPEFEGISGWINSEPISLSDLRGKVALVDFWTYTCINCIRTIPYLKRWHEKYANHGLVIIGIHTPEFDFERNHNNVQDAIKAYDINWIVGQDNDYETWKAFDNHFWPAKYLIDANGIIRYTHFGEGSYGETEATIRALLLEAGNDLKDADFIYPADPFLDQTYLSLGFNARVTPELYTGYERGCYHGNNYIGHTEYCDFLDQEVEYHVPDFPRGHLVYLQGLWYNGEENLKHARETVEFEDYVIANYSARSANVVIMPEGDEPFKVLVTLDGRSLDNMNKGEDVVIDEDGRSFLYVDSPKMYKTVETTSFGSHVLKLSSNSADFSIFAFTFGVYAEGP